MGREPSITASFEGTKELSRIFKRLKKVADSDEMMKCLEAGGLVIETHAKINVNENFSGASSGGAGLAGSIHTIRDGDSVLVGTGAVHARIREFGGFIRPVIASLLHWIDPKGKHHFAKEVHQEARPYLRPAVDEHTDEIEQAIKTQAKKIFEKYL